MADILSFFPLKEPRSTQTAVLQEIEKAYSAGNRFVILEAPVGSGKSAIAITLARYFGKSHIITPRKSLQNQYYGDFSEHVVLMKGRAAYPCTMDATPLTYNKVIKLIKEGSVAAPERSEANCADAPCIEDKDLLKWCTGVRDCPYHVAIETAQYSPNIIHNLHSFIFQTAFTGKFVKRNAMIIDEAHEIEAMIREFISKVFSLPKTFKEEELSDFKTIDEWCDWLLEDPNINLFSNTIIGKAKESAREIYKNKVAVLKSYADSYSKNFVVVKDIDLIRKFTKFKFIPESIGNAAHNLLFSYGDKVLLMSGTIYNKEVFCKNLGINSEQAYFMRLGSSFPAISRPIYMKPEYMVDTSHAKWEENFTKLIEILKTVLAKFPDVRGLLHVPSYNAGTQIAHALKDKRLVTHDRDDFVRQLERFFKDSGNKVFVSPVCQQGVDFKDDRARFQIIVRIPYLNTNDPFIKKKVETDFPWYNYNSLVLFGQQIGRINRSEQDFGATILVDERFKKFISKNRKAIPKWVQDAIRT